LEDFLRKGCSILPNPNNTQETISVNLRMFAGLSQISTVKKGEASASFARAKVKRYPVAAAAITQNCK
jgi:hypothetical protein